MTPPHPALSHAALLALAATSLLLLGCGDGADTTAASWSGTVRDSAGLRIVEHDGVPEGLPVWTIPDSAEVRIGSLEGTGPEVFGRLAGIALLSDGSVVVADAQSTELRAFGADGDYKWSAGRKGEGPGEFISTIARITRMGGDSLLVSDGGGRNMVFGPDGAYSRLLRMTEPQEGFGRSRIIGVLGNGSPVGVSSILLAGDAIPTGVTRGEETVGTLDEAGVLREGLGQFRSREATIVVRRDGAGAISSMEVRLLTMGRGSVFAVGATTIVAGETDQLALFRYDLAGGPTVIIRVATAPRLADADVRRQTAAMDSNAIVPDTLPAYETVRMDNVGRIWVQEFVPVYDERAPRWWVLNGDGAFVARVETPRGFDPLAFAGEQVWGVRRDELDVPYVERHRIVN